MGCWHITQLMSKLPQICALVNLQIVRSRYMTSLSKLAASDDCLPNRWLGGAHLH